MTIYNSTDSDYLIGFSNQPVAGTTSFLVYDLIPAHSFVLLQACTTFASLAPGVISLFDVQSKSLVNSYTMPVKFFKNMPYTLEIYQDAAVAGQISAVSMDLQGIMSGNYDQPIGAIRDLTPVTCVFWYDTASTITNNLPGKLWIVKVEDQKSTVLGSVAPGQAVQCSLTRPQSDHKIWLYFVYVNTSDDTKAQQFLVNFAQQPEVVRIIDLYHVQAQNQMSIAQSLTAQNSLKNISQSVLIQAAQGLLHLNGGHIENTAMNIDGYLLGADLFLSFGVGAGPMYYYLAATDKTQSTVPLNTVQNLYASNAGSIKPPPNANAGYCLDFVH